MSSQPTITPRIRNSCNDCTRSKLKCSGEKPSCQRCTSRGQDCVYSEARRAGRPVGKSCDKRSARSIGGLTSPEGPPTVTDVPGGQMLGLEDTALSRVNSQVASSQASSQGCWSQDTALTYSSDLDFNLSLNLPEDEQTFMYDLIWCTTNEPQSASPGESGLQMIEANHPKTMDPRGMC